MTDNDKGNKLTFSESNIAEWQRELQQALQEQAQINQKIGMLHQKIQVFSNLFAEQAMREGRIPQQQAGVIVTPIFQQNFHNPVKPVVAKKDKATALPNIIMGLFPKAGETRTRAEVRASLKEQNVNLGQNDAYFYTTMKRLVEKGDLQQDGEHYSRKVI